MKATPIINSFVSGELSPRLSGRTDVTQYYQSASELLNMIVEFYGGAKKAPGTYFVAEVETSSEDTIIKRFVFSDTQAYIMEIGNYYMRFFKDNGSILETAKTITGLATSSARALVTCVSHGYSDLDTVKITGVVGRTEVNNKRFLVADQYADNFFLQDLDGNYINPTAYTAYDSGGESEKVYQLATSYPTSVIRELQFSQTADIMYITHKDYPQMKLTRTAHTSWTIEEIDYGTGDARPALQDENVTATTITPNKTMGTGAILTATANIFDVKHVGSIWNIGSLSSSNAYALITSVAAGGLGSVATGNIIYGGIMPSGANEEWSEPAWSEYRGYPKTSGIHEGRLYYGYTAFQPQTVWGSHIFAYETFEASSDDADGLSFRMDTNEIEVIKWLFPSDELLTGTAGGLHTFGTGSDTSPITPTNVRRKKKTSYGTSIIKPVQIGNNVYYWQEYNRILREYAYSLDVDNYQANEATAFSEHISESGIKDMAYQQSPFNILWCVREDGKLASFTRQIEQKVAAWSLHDTQGEYESVAVIPGDTYDEVWFIVKRTIEGTTRRYVEYMVDPEIGDEQEDAFFLHSGLTLDDPQTITNITALTAGTGLITVTAASHGFANTETVRIRGVVGMTELNQSRFIVGSVASGSFVLLDLDGDVVDGSDYEDYVSGGEARECTTTITGLDHLEGKEVQILVDGAAHPNRSVASGSITLTDTYSEVHVGLGYTGRIITNDLEASPGKFVSHGKPKSIAKVNINFYKTLGGKVGKTGTMDDIIFRDSSMLPDQMVPLFTGFKEVFFPAGWDKKKQIIIEQTQPLPMHVLSIVPVIEVN